MNIVNKVDTYTWELLYSSYNIETVGSRSYKIYLEEEIMENKLLDSYSASGTDAKSFISEMRDLAARTSYPFVDPSDVFLLSYHKTEDKPIKDSADIKRIYYFYKLDRKNLSGLVDHNNGIVDVPFVVIIKKGIKSTNCEFFEEVIKNSGLIDRKSVV